MSEQQGQTFANVWDALCDTPEEAANMTPRSELMSALRQRVLARKPTQAQAARRLGVTQPHLNDLLRGRIEGSIWMRW